MTRYDFACCCTPSDCDDYDCDGDSTEGPADQYYYTTIGVSATLGYRGIKTATAGSYGYEEIFPGALCGDYDGCDAGVVTCDGTATYTDRNDAGIVCAQPDTVLGVDTCTCCKCPDTGTCEETCTGFDSVKTAGLDTPTISGRIPIVIKRKGPTSSSSYATRWDWAQCPADFKSQESLLECWGSHWYALSTDHEDGNPCAANYQDCQACATCCENFITALRPRFYECDDPYLVNDSPGGSGEVYQYWGAGGPTDSPVAGEDYILREEFEGKWLCSITINPSQEVSAEYLVDNGVTSGACATTHALPDDYGSEHELRLLYVGTRSRCSINYVLAIAWNYTDCNCSGGCSGTDWPAARVGSTSFSIPINEDAWWTES